MQTANIFKAIAVTQDTELFEDILNTPNIRMERIVSNGQSSPSEGWYDQDEHEWVMVLQGAAVLSFEHGEERRLQPGDYLNIPAPGGVDGPGSADGLAGGVLSLMCANLTHCGNRKVIAPLKRRLSM